MGKRNITFHFITVTISEKIVESSCDVTFINDSISSRIAKKYIVIATCDELKVQTFVLCLSVVVHVVQYVKL